MFKLCRKMSPLVTFPFPPQAMKNNAIAVLSLVAIGLFAIAAAVPAKKSSAAAAPGQSQLLVKLLAPLRELSKRAGQLEGIIVDAAQENGDLAAELHKRQQQWEVRRALTPSRVCRISDAMMQSSLNFCIQLIFLLCSSQRVQLWPSWFLSYPPNVIPSRAKIAHNLLQAMDYGWGGGRFGKRSGQEAPKRYDMYGNYGRFGRDVDHVDADGQ